jgi:hypothetical protein
MSGKNYFLSVILRISSAFLNLAEESHGKCRFFQHKLAFAELALRMIGLEIVLF